MRSTISANQFYYIFDVYRLFIINKQIIVIEWIFLTEVMDLNMCAVYLLGEESFWVT